MHTTSSPGHRPKTPTVSELRGTSQLVIDAVKGVTGLVEDMHRNISRLAPIVGTAPKGRTGGITGLVYQSVRGVTSAVGWSLDKAVMPLAAPIVTSLADSSMGPSIGKAVAAALEPLFKPIATKLGQAESAPYRDTFLSVINGVLGDTLEVSGNPLAITMQLRKDGKALELEPKALAKQLQQPSGKLLVLVHGLCMNDLQWNRHGHDHGTLLAAEYGYTNVYLHYNTGRSIATNGQAFADLLQALLAAWPVPVTELVLVGHSMGGLVSRSACHYAASARHTWPKKLNKLICLGTPHEGAPLERAGSWVDYLLGISPYTAPFAKLGLIRSAGIQNLRYGDILPASSAANATANQAPWPSKIKLYCIAATKQKAPSKSAGKLRGDGLVPVKSALGQHTDPALSLPVPATRQAIVYNTDHFDLLSSPEVYQHLLKWTRGADGFTAAQHPPRQAA